MYIDQSVILDAIDAPTRGANPTRIRSRKPAMRTIPGFCRGTVIITKRGPRLIETLQVGDQILTRDNGFQPLRWCTAPQTDAQTNPPVVEVSAGAIGNASTLFLSRSTAVLMASANRTDEHLTPLRHLINDTTIRSVTTHVSPVISLVLDRHEIIIANGAYCETLRASHRMLKLLPEDQRNDLLAHLPLLTVTDRTYQQVARPVMPIDTRLDLLSSKKAA